MGNVPDHFITQEMCDEAFEEDPSSLIYVADWFVRPQQMNMWYEYYYDNDNYGGSIKWYEVYQKRKAQKEKLEE